MFFVPSAAESVLIAADFSEDAVELFVLRLRLPSPLFPVEKFAVYPSPALKIILPNRKKNSTMRINDKSQKTESFLNML